MTAGCDPWQMALVHRLILRGFERARDIARSQPGADRVPAVREYLEFHLDGLHAHHTTEDEFLWPRLRERTSMDTELVDRMEQQHERLHEALDRSRKRLDAWSDDPADAANSHALANALDDVLVGLAEHLSEEEDKVVPLIAQHISDGEWEELGKRAFAKFKPSQRFTAMGELERTANPQENIRMNADLPLPIRLIWRLVGRRRYERLLAQVGD